MLYFDVIEAQFWPIVIATVVSTVSVSYTHLSTLANWVGQQPGVCSLAKYCGHAAVMEFNGDVYACDHFVLSLIHI